MKKIIINYRKKQEICCDENTPCVPKDVNNSNNKNRINNNTQQNH